MAEKQDPAIKCTNFISDIGEDIELYARTEYSTPEMFRYNQYLVRLGTTDGFDLPSAKHKADVIAVLMQSYERQARKENTAVAIGATRESNNIQFLDSGVPNYLPRDVAAPVKKKRFWGRKE